jgi:hypothetical protein
VRLLVDVSKETIVLEAASRCSVNELPSKVPEDKPRYHLFLFTHVFQGEALDSLGEMPNVGLFVCLFVYGRESSLDVIGNTSTAKSKVNNLVKLCFLNSVVSVKSSLVHYPASM